MKKIYHFFKVLAAIFVLLVVSNPDVRASNGVTLFMDTATAPVSQQVVINVKARNFVMMLSAQGTIGFDTSELHFVDVEHFGLTGLTNSNFGTGGAASGYVTFSWTDQTLNGSTIANDSEFFAIRFTVSSHACQNTAVVFLNTHTAPEFVDTSFNTLSYVLLPGMVIPTGVSISASISPVGPVICSSQNTTLTASGGGTYSWSNSATTAAITVAPLTTTPYTVTVTGSNGCSALATDTVFVGTSVSPTVSVTASQTSICSGTNVTFTASAANGGSTPSYQWKKNGTNVGTNSAVYSNNALSNNDSVWVVLTSSSTCAIPNTATSNVTHITITAGVIPSVSISASQTTICTGTGVTFTATAGNGGPTPAYQWKKNGNNVGTGLSTYSDNALNNNDSVWVVLTSSLSCASPTTATSNKAKTTVNAIPSAPVAGSNSPVTAGQTISLTAGTITSATYQWSGPNSYNSNQQNPSILNATTGMAGTYQVIATVNGCNSLASSVTVTVNNAVNALVFYMDTVTAVAGQQVLVDIKARDFIMMLSAQGTIGFDTSELHFVDVEHYGLTSLTSSNFGTSSSASGYITFSWTDQTLSGTTLANDSDFFAIRFLVAGGSCRNAAVNFLNTPTSLEFVDTSFNTISYTIHQGMVVPTGVSVVATISPVNPSSCALQSNTLTASAGASYIWSNGATTSFITVSPAITTPYSVTITGANGCSAHTTDTVFISQPATPSVVVNASATTICTGTNVIFTASPSNGGNAPSYQWKKNGANVGTNSSGYSSNALNNNDSVWVVMTSNASCVSPAIATSNITYITITSGIVPTVSISASQTSTCADSSVTFTTTSINGGIAPVYQWKKNGANVGSNSPTYTDNTFNNNDSVWVIMSSSASCASPLNATSNVVKITINAGVVPTVSITASQTTICAGTNVVFTATSSNGGIAPTYKWKKNDNIVGNNSSTYTDNTLTSNDSVWVVLTSSATCANPAKVISNIIGITINATVAASVSVSASQTTICAGTSVTFTATSGNGGNAPSYQWKKNGNNVGTNSATYVDNGLNNNDSVWVVLTSSAGCASPATATSNVTHITTSTTVVPAVSISANQTNVCAGTLVTFTASPVNGGVSPVYQWKRNGSNVGTNSATYSSSILSNNDSVWVVLTSSVGCASPTTAKSNVIQITVGTNIVPSVGISASQTAICSGTTVTFTSSAINGGLAPTYQWKKNGNNVGSNSATYIDNGLSNNDSVWLVYTSSSSCANPSSVTSNVIYITTTATVVPSVNITASQTTVCADSSVTFTAIANNGGLSPVYQWKKNGITVGANSASYSDNTPANNDSVWVVVTSSLACASPANVASNAIQITVNAAVVPTVSISASQTTVCPGTTVTFTATSTNGGIAPVYKWKKNGNVVGGSGPTYTDNALNNNDSVWVSLTSSASCANPVKVASNFIYITAAASVLPSVSVSAGQTTICTGTGVTFTAAATNGGTSPVYQWKKNGNNVGTNSATYIDNALSNNDSVWVVLTSNASCANPTVVTSNVTHITISGSIAPSVSVSSSPATICSGTSVTFTAVPVNGGVAPTYQWKKNGSNVGTNSATYVDNALNNNDSVWVVLTSSASCANPTTATSNTTHITVTATVVPSVSVSASQTTICLGTSVTFTATAVNGGTIPAYQWKKNGNNVGNNSAVYSDNSLNNNDSVWVVLISSAPCASPTHVTSNVIHITLGTTVVPSVIVNANQTTICTGSSVTFTATPANGGTTPTYQWKKNGNNVGTNSATYTDNSLGNNDSVWVILTSSVGCANPTTATSNVTRITISGSITPSVSVIASQTTICAGSTVTFTATPVNGGVTPTYQWKKNGSNVGTNNATYNDNTLTNNDSVWVVLTSSAGCASPVTASSNVIHITLSGTVVPTVSITASQTTVCSGTGVTFTATSTNGGLAPIYQWMKNGNSAGSGIAYTDNGLSNNDSVWVVLISNANCVNPTTVSSNKIIITVNPTPSAPVAGSNSPVNAGGTITLTASNVVGATYQWSGPGNYTSGQQNPTIANATIGMTGTYQVIASRNGCNSPAVTVAVVVNVPINSVLLYGDTVSAADGQQVVVDIKARNFIMMLSAQGTIGFDTAKLHFMNVEHFGLASLNASNFGTAAALNGYITFAWNDLTLNGKTLGNDSEFFAIRFKVDSGVCGNAAVTFLNAPTTLEFVDTSLNPLSYSDLQGMVTPVFTINDSLITAQGATTFCAGGSVTLGAASGFTYLWSNQSTTQTILVSTGGNYLVTVTNSNNCSAVSVPVAVTVNTAPAATITPTGQTTFCIGDSVTLSAPAGLTYAWSNGATTQNINVLASSSSSVTVSNSNNCSAVSSVVVVTVNPLPTVSFALPVDTICLTASPMTLTGGVPTGGTYSGVGISGGSFDPSATGQGVYAIKYTYNDGHCSNSAKDSISVNICGGIDVITAFDWSIYPNPATSSLTVSIDAEIVPVSFIVYDVLGNKITDGKITADKYLLDIRTYASGLYYLKIYHGEEIAVKSFVVFK